MENKDSNKESILLEFAKQMNNLISNNFVSSQKKNYFSKKFTQTQIETYLSDPARYEKELRNMSIVLSTMSSQYNQIINYFGDIAMFKAILVPNISKYADSKSGEVKDEEKLKKDYINATALIQQMHLEHTLKNILKVMCREDVYFGYIHKTNNSFYIQKLDPDYCRIKYVQDGVLGFDMDMSYFDKNNTLKNVEGTLIETYPVEIQQGYNAYLKDKANARYFEPDLKNIVCFKFNESLEFNFPPFANLYDEISRLEDYKSLALSKTTIDNYKLIGMKIPLLNSEREDALAISTDMAMMFYSMLVNSLPEGVGAFITPTDFSDISFSNVSSSDKKEVSQAEDNVYVDSGISPVVFGKGANSSTGLKTSNLIDSARLFTLYRQFERWLNFYFKNEFKEKFVVKLLDVTVHTVEEEVNRLYQLATMGVPVKLQLSTLVQSQAEERGSLLLEKVLGLADEWLPLNSSFVQSGNEGGRPTQTDVTESGEKSRANEDNIDR